MEKFGIFELLDALSALTDTPPAAPAETNAGTNSEESAPAPGENSPAPHGAPAAPQPNAEGTQPTRARESEQAFSAFLARHDAISKKIDKQ